MTGSLELGNYFLDEHAIRKAVRDGARYAARQNFSNYDCAGSPGGSVVADTQAVVMRTNRIPIWNASKITVTESCSTTAGAQTMQGIYKGRASGAPIVTVTATVPYTPVLRAFGFKGVGFTLNAREQAAVMGL
jgi:Flp pilus assembly protein TadG